jgi:hypothetical protein
MSPGELLEYWRRSYGETPLVGHVLRKRLPHRWMRIHSLPESKRYAETEDERREILHRQNSLCSDVIGDGNACVVVRCSFGGEEQLPEDVQAVLRGLEPVFLTMLAAAEWSGEPDLPGEFPLMMAELAWRPGALDPVLLAVADDALEALLLVSVQRGCVVAPYDGGVDVIAESEAQRDQLKARYASWLSRHPAGL